MKNVRNFSFNFHFSSDGEKGTDNAENMKIAAKSHRPKLISLKYANGLRNGANSDTHRCKQLTEHGEERCIKLREVAGFSACLVLEKVDS